MSSVRNPLTFKIRQAEPADYDAIVELWLAAGLGVRPEGRESRSAFMRQLNHFGDLYLVAVDGNRLVGVVLGSHDHRKGWINRLAVHPAYRRCGVATALVRACEAALWSHQIGIIAALVELENDASAAFFEGLGYRCDVPVRYLRKLSHANA